MSSSEHYMFGPYKINQNEVFYSTQLSYAFVNLRPVVPGTCLPTSSLLFLHRPILYFLRLERMSMFVCLFVFTVFIDINPFRLESISNEILVNFQESDIPFSMKFPSLRRSFQRLVRTFLVSSLTRSLKKQFFIFKNPNMISCIYTLPIKKYWQICLWARSIPQKNCLKTLSYKVVMARCNSYIPFPKCLFSI